MTQLLGVTKSEEDKSYANMIRLLIWVPVCTVLFSVGEVAMFFVYNFKVSTYKAHLRFSLINIHIRLIHGDSSYIQERQRNQV